MQEIRFVQLHFWIRYIVIRNLKAWGIHHHIFSLSYIHTHTHEHAHTHTYSRLLFVCSRRDGNEQRDDNDDDDRNHSSRKPHQKSDTDLFLATKTRGWVKSDLPLDRSLKRNRYEQGTPYFSAGTNDHDRVPSFARRSAICFFRERLSTVKFWCVE